MLKKLVSLYKRVVKLWLLSESYNYIIDGCGQITDINARISMVETRIGEHTTIHADIHHYDPHHIIVIGKYLNRDYVRMFELDEKDLAEMIETLKGMEPNAKVGRFDMVSGFGFSAVYKRDRF